MEFIVKRPGLRLPIITSDAKAFDKFSYTACFRSGLLEKLIIFVAIYIGRSENSFLISAITALGRLMHISAYENGCIPGVSEQFGHCRRNERSCLESYRTDTDWLHGPWWLALGKGDAPPSWKSDERYLHLVAKAGDIRKSQMLEHACLPTDMGPDNSVQEWEEAILEFLDGDDNPMCTFNVIVLYLTGGRYQSIDMTGGSAEVALWRLVSKCKVANTTFCPVLFGLVTGPVEPDESLEELLKL